MICGVLLAAGAATRFGGAKLLHALPDGTPMAQQSACRLWAAVPESVAVLRPEDSALANLLRSRGVRCVFNARAARGLGGSIACGVAATRGASGWVIALADMPFVQTATILAVVGALGGGAALVAPTHAGRRGHPVGFAACWRDALLALDGHHGARALLEEHEGTLQLLPVRDRGVLIDIDTVSDLASPAILPASQGRG